jgi:hypothetical protein
MRAQDGILRLSAPGAGLPLERGRPGPVPRGSRSWFGRLLPRRDEPTTFHRCLAIHMHYAGPHSALS